jgi:hypothetical protein
MMENNLDTPLLTVKPQFLFWQEVVSQLFLIFIVGVYVSMVCIATHKIPSFFLVIVPTAFMIGFFIYCKLTELIVKNTEYTFYDTYLTITHKRSSLVTAQSISIDYDEISAVKISHNVFETPFNLGSIAFKRGSMSWYYYLTFDYGCQKIMLYPYYLRPYFSMAFYYGLNLNKRKFIELSNIPHSQEVYALLQEKTLRNNTQ